MTDARRAILFVNAAHALTHYVILIFPTAVIAISLEWQLGYGELVPLATGCLVAYGLLSLPAGWLVNVVGPERLLAAFFVLTGLACFLVAAAGSWLMLGFALLLLGAAAAIYHPVGLTLLTSVSTRLGRDLSINGVCGNIGAAVAAAGTALLTTTLSWRWAFVGPGLAALLLAALFVTTSRVRQAAGTMQTPASSSRILPVSNVTLAICTIMLAFLVGGVTYNIVTVALPKIVDERYAGALPLIGTGALATLILICGALMQLAAGRLIDRLSLASLFVILSGLQMTGLALAWLADGHWVLIGLALTMAAIYGQVIVDDAFVARYVPERLRGRAYGVSYFLGSAVSAAAIPMMGVLYGQGAGFTPVLALTAACGVALFVCALGFRYAVSGANDSQTTEPRISSLG